MKQLFGIIVLLLIVWAAHSQGTHNYSLNVKGWEKVVATGNNVIVIEKAYIWDNTETLNGNGDIGLHIYDGNNAHELKPAFRLYGPHCGGSDKGPHCEWSDGETVSYSNYGIIRWDEKYGSKLRISLIEGDDFPFDSDDVLLNKTINIDMIRDKEIELIGSKATISIRMYSTWPAWEKKGSLTDIQFMKPVPFAGGGMPFQDPSRLQEGGKANYLLTGMVVNYGRLVDGLTPIYQELLSNGELGKIKFGNHIGGTGGDYIVTLSKPGYIVNGINLRVGDKVDNIQLVFQKWDKKGIVGQQVVSKECGGKGGSLYKIRISKGRYAVGIHGNSGKVIDVLALVTAKLE